MQHNNNERSGISKLTLLHLHGALCHTHLCFCKQGSGGEEETKQWKNRGRKNKTERKVNDSEGEKDKCEKGEWGKLKMRGGEV